MWEKKDEESRSKLSLATDEIKKLKVINEGLYNNLQKAKAVHN